MNLAIDIGNSWAKAAVIDNGQVVDTFRTEEISPEWIEWTVFGIYPHIRSGIMVSSRSDDYELRQYLQGKLTTFIAFDRDTPVPIENLYGTPETLGLDRLAAAVGAKALFPGHNVLIFDLGTAITVDHVSAEGEFRGGNISPGATMRLRALNHFTRKLPLRKLPEGEGFMGTSSASAIENGVVNGIVYEIEGYINRFDKENDNLKIVLTGGDANYFAKRLKNTIFAVSDLVTYGLNEILEYNA